MRTATRGDTRRVARRTFCTLTLTALCAAPASVMPALAQQPEVHPWHADSSSRAPDSVSIAAGPRYRGGAFKRWVLGNSYRDLWVTPIHVPVLNLHTYAGGLHPVKAGGGLQTKSLRFETDQGVEYVFRLTDKHVEPYLEALQHTVLDGVFQDQVSALHPAATQLTMAIAEAGGVLHPTSVLTYMPDDPELGAFRHDFGGKLGMIEEYPNVPEHGHGFRGATKIIDSKDLVERMNRDGREHIDARAFLTARLVDYLVNDTDRHQNNWKWARLETESNSPWVPIARDRDHAFSAYDGWALTIARKLSPRLVSLDDPPTPLGISQYQTFDARMLEALEQPAWDSIAHALQRRITDSVIASAIADMPAEYRSTAPHLTAALKRRRAALPAVAQQFYHLLAARVEVHGTDTSDRAVITRKPDGIVDVRIESAGKLYYARRFNARDTREILVYLMNGADTAIVAGQVRASIPLRIVGGNGTNTLIDSSTVAGKPHQARLYENGTVSGIAFGADTMPDRRPWEVHHDTLSPPGREYGARLEPITGFSFHRRIGLTPLLGVARYGYGYAHRPYSSMVKVEGEYAVRYQGMRLAVTADKRLELSPLHFTLFGRVSDFEMVHFPGLGNATVDSGGLNPYFEVRQRQWLVRPAVALAVGENLDISLGPVLQHAVTDSTPDRFLSATRPYGFGSFNQGGLQVAVQYDRRGVHRDVEHTHHRLMASVTGTYYPATLDVKSSFTKFAAVMGASAVVPVPLQPFFVMRAGATKLVGTFPFHEAATIGGQGTTRYMDTQRFAGDAAMYASSELRVPLVRFKVLVPLRAGILGIAEAGRVYNDGQSPGGWYSRTGEGVWFGRGKASPVVTFTRTTEPGNTGIHVRLGLNF